MNARSTSKMSRSFYVRPAWMIDRSWNYAEIQDTVCSQPELLIISVVGVLDVDCTAMVTCHEIFWQYFRRYPRPRVDRHGSKARCDNVHCEGQDLLHTRQRLKRYKFRKVRVYQATRATGFSSHFEERTTNSAMDTPKTRIKETRAGTRLPRSSSSGHT